MSAHADILIHEDGRFEAVYSDVDGVVGANTPATLSALGNAHTCRASHVEPAGNAWTADMAPVGGPVLGPFPLRSDALAAERNWLRIHRGL